MVESPLLVRGIRGGAPRPYGPLVHSPRRTIAAGRFGDLAPSVPVNSLLTVNTVAPVCIVIGWTAYGLAVARRVTSGGKG